MENYFKIDREEGDKMRVLNIEIRGMLDLDLDKGRS